MAGNVTAALVGIDLVITGDTSANAISIVETVNDGEFTITGLNDGTGAATGINGAPNGSATISGVAGNIVANMSTGDDLVTVTNVNHTGSITIDAAGGDDRVTIGDSSNSVAAAALTIHTVTGADVVDVTNVAIAGNVVIDAAAGAGVHSYSLTDSTIGGNAGFVPGDRAVSIRVANCSIAGSLNLDNYTPPFPGPANRISDVYSGIRLTDLAVGSHINLDSVTSTLFEVRGVYAGGNVALMSAGNNNVLGVYYSTVAGDLSISTLTGNPFGAQYAPIASTYDRVELVGVGSSTLNTSTAADVQIVYSAFTGAVNINGYGYNTVIISASRFEGNVTVDLGLFDDSAQAIYSIFNGLLTTKHAGRVDPAQNGIFDGSKVLSLWYNRITTLVVNGGNQTDQVLINACLIDQVYENLGDGSDLVSISGAIVNNQAQFEGGPGFDLFRNSGSQLNGFVLSNFEAYS
jgi:hypothetical protein